MCRRRATDNLLYVCTFFSPRHANNLCIKRRTVSSFYELFFSATEKHKEQSIMDYDRQVLVQGKKDRLHSKGSKQLVPNSFCRTMTQASNQATNNAHPSQPPKNFATVHLPKSFESNERIIVGQRYIRLRN